MADINALIAAGPHTRGLDVAGNMMKVQQLKDMQQRNQLADLQSQRAQSAEQRAQEKHGLDLDENDWRVLTRTASEFVGIYDATGDINAATSAMESLPDRGRLGKLKRDYFAALETPDKADDQAIIENARVVAGMADRFGENQKRVVKTFVDEQGVQRFVYNDGSVGTTGESVQKPNYKVVQFKYIDENGNEQTGFQRVDVSNLSHSDPSMPQQSGPQQQPNIAPQGQPIGQQGVQPQATTQQAAGGGGNIVATSSAEGAALREGKKEGAKLSEQRFNKIKNDAPQHTKMAGFIRQVSESVTRAATKARKIIEENPNLAIGLGSQLGVVSTPEGGTRQRNLPGSWDEPGLELDTLMNQVFGGAAFATLQQMRQASPTGGALGQVSNFEIDLLQNQWAAFSQRTGNAEFAIGQMDEMLEQAALVGDLANVELAVQQKIQALGPDATNEEVSNLINAGFRNMAEVYKRHGRDSGEWDDETLTWTPSRDTVDGASNKGKKEALDLGRFEVIED